MKLLSSVHHGRNIFFQFFQIGAVLSVHFSTFKVVVKSWHGMNLGRQTIVKVFLRQKKFARLVNFFGQFIIIRSDLSARTTPFGANLKNANSVGANQSFFFGYVQNFVGRRPSKL